MSTTIWERVKTALDTLATVPAAAGVYISATPEALPDLYIVYFLVVSVPELHADNAEQLRTETVQVTVFSRSGLAGLPDVDTAMTAAGFTRGPIRELPYNQLTRHYGLAYEYHYLEGA